MERALMDLIAAFGAKVMNFLNFLQSHIAFNFSEAGNPLDH